MPYIVIDLETGCKTKYKRKANPFINDIVAYSIKGYNVKQKTEMLSDANQIVQNIPNHVRVLVGHNLKFDLLYLWGSERLQCLVEEYGLKLWDTMLVEYMLSGQQYKFPALRDIAVNKYGRKEREKVMEEYWEKGIDTADIPKELVLHDVKNDVLDTEQVYLQQLELVKEANMLELVEIHNEALLATIEMEYNGLFVDKKILSRNELKLEKELKEVEQGLYEMVKKYI